MRFEAILEGARAGDPAAVEELHRRFAPAVFARVRSRQPLALRRWYDTADIGQSVFLEVLRDLPRFEDRGEQAFRHWLYVKAENKVRMKLRKDVGPGKRRWQAPLEAYDATARGDGPVTAASAREERARLERALKALEPAQRNLIQLRTRDGLSYADMAERLALPSSDAARVRYARALLALREQWQAVCDAR
jgi:RNA polymerase sigma-70 factor (ECF subfamily)